MPTSSRKNGSVLVTFLIVFLVFGTLSRLRPFIGEVGYAIGVLALFAGGVVVSLWRISRAPDVYPEGKGLTSGRILSLQAPFNQVTANIPRAIASCGWKLTESDPEQGYFKAQIGRSLETYSGQTFYIMVKETSEGSAIDARCEARHQQGDFGQNNRRINKFEKELEKSLANSTPNGILHH